MKLHRHELNETSWVAAVPEPWDAKIAVVLAHGAGQPMDSPFMNFFHEGLASDGCLAVKFNFEYAAKGRRAPDPQPKLQSVYRRVISAVSSEYSPERLFIGGKSMGGRVASYIAADLADVSGLVFLGYPLHPAGKPEQLRDSHLYNLHKPMLFISGTRDPLASQSLLDGVIARIGDCATIEWIDGGDHSLQVNRGDRQSWQQALRQITSWCRSRSNSR